MQVGASAKLGSNSRGSTEGLACSDVHCPGYINVCFYSFRFLSIPELKTYLLKCKRCSFVKIPYAWACSFIFYYRNVSIICIFFAVPIKHSLKNKFWKSLYSYNNLKIWFSILNNLTANTTPAIQLVAPQQALEFQHWLDLNDAVSLAHYMFERDEDTIQF